MRKLKKFPYQSVLVLGLAKSGTAVAKLLNRNGIKTIVNDLKAVESDAHVQELQNLGMEIILGEHPLSLLDGIDVIIKNPGIPYENPLVRQATEQGLPVLTEIELLYYFELDSLVGITGSNGKTTTTTLIYEMYKQDRRKVEVAGNIGLVASEVAETIEDDAALVVELSSFQLLGTQCFKPSISVVLNLFEAHLDYHHTLDHYMEAKSNIFKNQSTGDFLVYNADDQMVELMVQQAETNLVPFSTKEQLDNGTYSDGIALYYKNEKIIEIEKIALVGEHNIENILAAIAVAKLEGISNEAIKSVLTTFTGVSHRLQFVDNIEGRLFYNDSKATNILATSKALQSFQQPTILLAGGLDRGNEFDDLTPYLKNVKSFVLFGETAPKLKALAEKIGLESIATVNNMEEAVKEAFKLSEEGDVILLSPACASWDQYKTFEERGNMFVESVHKL